MHKVFSFTQPVDAWTKYHLDNIGMTRINEMLIFDQSHPENKTKKFIYSIWQGRTREFILHENVSLL